MKVVPLQGLPGVGRVQFSGDTESSSMCLASYHREVTVKLFKNFLAIQFLWILQDPFTDKFTST